ncbi:MAG: maleylpyruvate isomerase family mycothiol-dependent enzyme [Microthrixaceae bacterium]
MTDLFDLIAAERRAAADLLADLTEEQATVPSLCEGWQVRHVAAHLTMPLRVGLPTMMLGMLRNLGNFDRYADHYAKASVERESVRDLAEVVRANADSHFTPPGLGAHAPLTDIVVHTLDMRVPLGIPGPGPAPEAANEVLGFLMTPKATKGFLPKDRVPGLSFESTDTGWSGSEGPVVRGPAASLALAITGRAAALDSLEGEGVAELRRRLGA